MQIRFISKQIVVACILVFACFSGFSQYTHLVNNDYQNYLQANQWFTQEQYQLAYPLFKDLKQKTLLAKQSDNQLYNEDLRFHLLACELMQGQESAELEAQQFLAENTPAILKGQMGYYLGNYYFKKDDYSKAITAFEQASVSNLNNKQVGTMQFAQGYSYFTQQKFTQAKPLLNSVRQTPESNHWVDANYYYGLIAFSEKKYKDALSAFDVAQSDPEYAKLVPYYSAGINYSTGQKDKGLKLAEDALATGDQFYATELKQLIGHAYFEKGDYNKALPYLEQYVKGTEKVKKQDLYELAYSYYKANNYTAAIDNFKPLAGGADSLSQHAMYLLGDIYLKTGDKANARNAFLFCSSNGPNAKFKEIATFNYGKLSYELGYDAEALPILKNFVVNYASSNYNAEARDLLVNVLANTSNYKEALELFEALKTPGEQSKRTYPKILYNRAQQLLSDRQIAASEPLLKKVITVPYNEQVAPLAHFWLGELDYQRQNYSSSIEHYNAYLDNIITNGEANEVNARYNLGYSLLQVEQYEKARYEFERITNTGKLSRTQRSDVIVRTADCYYMLKQYNTADKLYQSIISESAASADYATFQAGMIAGAQNNSEKKITTLKSIDRLYPQSNFAAKANLEIADTYLADEKFAEALVYLDKVMTGKVQALKPEALLKSGLAQYNLGNTTDAMAKFKTLLQQYPQSNESAIALETIRSIYIEEGNTEGYFSLMKQLGKSVDDQTADSLSYYAAELQLSDGKRVEALGALQRYVSQFPNGKNAAKANYNIAEIYRVDKKDAAASLKYYDNVIAIAPNDFAEKSMVAAARIYYFDNKDYANASKVYTQLMQYASGSDNRFEALRGLVRSLYYNNKFADAKQPASELLNHASSGSDDKLFANLVLGKNALIASNCNEAITYFKSVAILSKAEPGAEARYEIASCLLKQNKLSEAEDAAFEVVNKSGSYEFWVTKAYILLGDIYFEQKDYFNAKATYKSVTDNSSIEALKAEAKTKLANAEKMDESKSKIGS